MIASVIMEKFDVSINKWTENKVSISRFFPFTSVCGLRLKVKRAVIGCVHEREFVWHWKKRIAVWGKKKKKSPTRQYSCCVLALNEKKKQQINLFGNLFFFCFAAVNDTHIKIFMGKVWWLRHDIAIIFFLLNSIPHTLRRSLSPLTRARL
jgi:hypothetical protein